MRLEIVPGTAIPGGGWVGSVLCHDVLGADGRPALGKGHRLDLADAATLSRFAPEELHVLWLGEEDVDENTAATRLAHAVAGPGVEIHPPTESQARLTAAWRGVARVDSATLAAVNGVEGITVFTIADGAPVEAGRTLAGVKITAFGIPGSTLEAAERIATSAPRGPTVTVRRFLPLRVSAVVRQRIDQAARQRFEASLRQRVDWFGGVVESIEYPEDHTATDGSAPQRRGDSRSGHRRRPSDRGPVGEHMARSARCRSRGDPPGLAGASRQQLLVGHLPGRARHRGGLVRHVLTAQRPRSAAPALLCRGAAGWRVPRRPRAWGPPPDPRGVGGFRPTTVRSRWRSGSGASRPGCRCRQAARHRSRERAVRPAQDGCGSEPVRRHRPTGP